MGKNQKTAKIFKKKIEKLKNCRKKNMKVKNIYYQPNFLNR